MALVTYPQLRCVCSRTGSEYPLMSPVRRIARPLLASMFLVGGLDAVRHPDSKTPSAEPVTGKITALLPDSVPLPSDPAQLVRINGGVQLGAGLLLTLGKLPRLSALALAASVVPTTAAGHRFWEADDEATKRNQRIHFFKNVSMLGGLLIAAADTGGKASLGRRAKHAAKTTKREAKLARAQAKDSTKRAGRAVRKAVH